MKVAGFDAGRETLVRFWDQKTSSLLNRVKEIALSLRELPEGAAVAVEATGKYHLKLARTAFKLGLKVYVVNPRDAKAWRDFTGRRAKTDRVDARELARFVETHHETLIPWVPQEARVGMVRELLSARHALVKARVALAQSLAQLSPAARRELGDTHLGALKEREEALEEALHRLLKDDARYQRVLQIPGVGLCSGAALVCATAGREFKSSDALVAFFGLDANVRQSGKFEGRRKLTKRGCALFRYVLCMAGSVASRLAPWREYYQSQLAKGLSATAAYAVLARKILRTAYSLLKRQTEFDPTRLFSQKTLDEQP